MICYWLFILFLAYNSKIEYTMGHNVLTNVAYGKSVRQSTDFRWGSVPDNAVNGIFTDFTHTDLEKNPWIRIDLGRNYTIHEVEVFGRRGCCVERLHDVDIRVGNDLHDMHLCGHFTGSCTRSGERIAVFCPFNTFGRYVKIQIMEGWNNYLSVAEVLVWGRL
ncbi:fucolectin-like [Saccostrea echinata]|uniref:fucolectin-like n=1 Tax=Saccostrea echinata TaxID=191078 RepID=UPI002A83FFDC|nr:fucolectin-like [Saccostrea echinata]